MDKSLRRTIIAGNWKMNKTPEEGAALIQEIAEKVPKNEATVVVCPPAICIPAAVEAAKNSKIHIGAQNVHFQEKGAYTGEISCDMLKASGAQYVIIGHSERRQYFGETDATVNKRTSAAVNAGLYAIICVGETLEQREQGITDELLAMQVKLALYDIPENKLSNIIIAYEPIWAIGTGKTATPSEANIACSVIRNAIAEVYGGDIASGVSILYGGSMNAKNAKDLLNEYHIDGGLIGGAALKADDFCVIINAAE
jgi:triosephosphate isomerase